MAMLFAITGGAFADDNLRFAAFELEPGETKEVQILMDNPDVEYRDVQFDLYLPEGITVAQDEDEEYIVGLGSRCTNKHTVGCSYSDGHYTCILYSSSKKALTGHEGDILTITLTADKNVTPGAKRGYFRDASLSKTDASGPTYAEISFDITIKGDANSIESVEYDTKLPEGKVFRNGSVIIIHDGKEYTPNGTPAK